MLRNRASVLVTSALVATFTVAPFSALVAFADEVETGPHVHEEGRTFEGLPVLLVVCALIIAVGLAYGIGRRSRK